MTKDVLLSISGLHQDVTGIEAQGDEPGSEPIEVISPASYYKKNGKIIVHMNGYCQVLPSLFWFCRQAARCMAAYTALRVLSPAARLTVSR